MNKRPIREIADFLVHQVKKSTRQQHLDILREMLERVLLDRYAGETTLAHEYTRVDIEIRQKERSLHPNAIEVEEHCEN